MCREGTTSYTSDDYFNYSVEVKQLLANVQNVIKQIIDQETIEKCKASFDTTDWSIFINEDVDQTINTLTDYINYVVASNSTTKQYYVNNNQRPWITAEIKGLMKQKHDANQKQNKQKSKEIQNDIKKLIKEAKIKYKEKMGLPAGFPED